MADNLTGLLKNNEDVGRYFSNLPQDVQDSICSNASDICSLEDLLEYIKKLTGSC